MFNTLYLTRLNDGTDEIYNIGGGYSITFAVGETVGDAWGRFWREEYLEWDPEDWADIDPDQTPEQNFQDWFEGSCWLVTTFDTGEIAEQQKADMAMLLPDAAFYCADTARKVLALMSGRST